MVAGRVRVGLVHEHACAVDRTGRLGVEEGVVVLVVQQERVRTVLSKLKIAFWVLLTEVLGVFDRGFGCF